MNRAAPPKEKRPLASKALDSVESTKASQTGRDTSSSIVEQLRNLLGNDVVLLPIKRGHKGPSGKEMAGWHTFTPAKMQEPEYLARLNHGSNIGVLLGHGRVTIDLDRDEDVQPFLKLNPRLGQTLRSRRKRGCNLWLRVKGPYPRACKLKTTSGEDFGEWRADGNQTVIFGEAIDRKRGEKKPTAYKIENRVQPIELPFDEIRWPEDVILPWKNEASTPEDPDNAELRRRYGLPFYRSSNGELSVLNEAYWAGLYAMEVDALWEQDERSFYTYQPAKGIYQPESVTNPTRRCQAGANRGTPARHPRVARRIRAVTATQDPSG